MTYLTENKQAKGKKKIKDLENSLEIRLKNREGIKYNLAYHYTPLIRVVSRDNKRCF